MEIREIGRTLEDGHKSWITRGFCSGDRFEREVEKILRSFTGVENVFFTPVMQVEVIGYVDGNKITKLLTKEEAEAALADLTGFISGKEAEANGKTVKKQLVGFNRIAGNYEKNRNQ